MASKSYVFNIPESETKISFVYLPSLNLYVISDCKGFGPNWVRVNYFRKIYNTELLMGIDNDNTVTSMARHFADSVVAKKMKNSTNNDLALGDEIDITFSISLRNKDPKFVRMVKAEFDKHL